MVAFNSSCEPLAYDHTATVTPDVVAPVFGNFIDPEWVQRNTAGRKGFIHQNATRNRYPYNAACFLQHGELFWFDHIHIIPTTYSLGTVLTTQEREYEVYNAFREQDHQITDIIQSNVDGITLVGDPTNSPRILQALNGFVVTVTVSPVGPVTIAAQIDYVFGNLFGGVTKTITLTGSRVIIMSTVPDATVDEGWSWKTDIIEAASGDEQRISVRDVPRQSWTYRFTREDESALFLINQLWGWHENIWAVPVWTDYTTLSADANIGDTVLNITDLAERDFRSGDGELAMIWSDENTFESIDVTAIGASTLTSARELLNSFPAGSFVLPVRLAKIPRDWKVQNWNVNARRIEAKWQVLHNQDFSDVLSPRPLNETGTYRGYPVWDPDTDYLITSGNYQEIEDKDLRVFPDELGKFSTMTPRDFPRNRIAGMSLYADGRTATWRLRAFLHNLRGRQKGFWMSTTRKDFAVESPKTAPSTEINVQITNYTNLVYNAPDGPRTRRNIEIKYVDGSKDWRRIVGSTLDEGAGREVLLLDSNISQDVTAANVERISYLVKRRLTRDDHTLVHDFYEGEVSVPGIGMQDIYDGE